MGFPWFLKPDPLLHKELLDAQEALAQSAGNSSAADRKQDRQIQALEQRVAELEAQLLALESCLSVQGNLPPAEEPAPPTPPPSAPLASPPRLPRAQLGNRDLCIACGTPFQYENDA